MNDNYELKEPTAEAVARAKTYNEVLKETEKRTGKSVVTSWIGCKMAIEKYTVCGSQVGTVLSNGTDKITVYV